MKKYKQFEVNSEVALIKISEQDLETIRDIHAKYRAGMPIAKEKCKQTFGIDLKSIIAYGATDDVSLQMLKAIIPKESYPLTPAISGNTYKCYATKKPTIIMHESADSSWLCLLHAIGNPKYAIIFKTDKDER